MKGDAAVKRFVVFAGMTYYAPPGWQGHFGSRHTIEEARELATEICERYEFAEYGWWQIVDLELGKVVEGDGQSHAGLHGYLTAGPIKETG